MSLLVVVTPETLLDYVVSGTVRAREPPIRLLPACLNSGKEPSARGSDSSVTAAQRCSESTARRYWQSVQMCSETEPTVSPSRRSMKRLRLRYGGSTPGELGEVPRSALAITCEKILNPPNHK